MIELYLARHGQTVENVARIFQGHLPGQLTDEGRCQAEALREKLRPLEFDVIVSSDLQRCIDTVQIAAGDRNLPYTVERDEDGAFVVEGPRIEKMLGYTNLESEQGFQFFQKFLKDSGILDDLEAAGIQEGDTVRMYGLAFDYYK